MVLHDHAGHDEAHDQATIDRNARLGRILFVVYLLAYLGYMFLTAFAPDVMRRTTFAGITVAGLNVAVLYGFKLIASALALALIYAWLCRKPVGDEAAPQERAS